MLTEIREYAKKTHNDVNHRYDDNEYVYHLDMVFDAMMDIISDAAGLNSFESIVILITSCYTHDLIEDCRVTYNDLIKDLMNICNVPETEAIAIAELTYAVTNEKGKSRKERANDKYYSDMRQVKYATVLKVADRIANVRYSKQTNSSMKDKYFDEMPGFIEKISIDNDCPILAVAIKTLTEEFK